MKRWGFWDHDKCPCCRSATEDKSHLMTCPNQYCKDVWQSNVTIVEEWMEQEDTMPEIRECLIRALRARSTTLDFRTDCDAQVIGAAETQTKIGWLNFTEGKLALQWQELQTAHYERIRSDKSAKKWTRGLVMELLQLTHSQWVYRNSIKHKKDQRGLNIEDARALDHAIDSQFRQGSDGLHERDHHFIQRGRKKVSNMSATDQRNWLEGIKVARAAYEESAAREIQGMRLFMENYLRSGTG